MIIESVKNKGSLDIKETMLTQAIEKHISTSKFPKGLFLKKLDLLTEKMNKSEVEINKKIVEANDVLDKVIETIEELNTKNNMLLHDLSEQLL